MTNSNLNLKRKILTLISTACLSRLAWFLVTCWESQGRVAWYIVRSDALSYVALTNLLKTGVRPENIWDERVFWGFPVTIVPISLVIPTEWATIVMAVLWAAVASILFFVLTHDFKLSLLFSVFTPTWLMHSCQGMSEPVYLAAILGSVILFTRQHPFGSGAAMGFALLVRPTAALAAVGMAFLLVSRRSWKQLFFWGGASALGPLCQVGLNFLFYGDWNHQAHLHGAPSNIVPEVLRVLAPNGISRTYFAVPFQALIETPLKIPTPLWKIVFIYTHVVAAIIATVILVWRYARSELTFLFAIWALGNTIFIVSTGPYWGFHSFDRYFVWALPAYLYALTYVVELTVPMIWSAGVASWVLALYGALKPR